MKRLILTAVLTASPVFAENVEVFVVQGDGSGVVQHESKVSVEGAASLIDGKRPKGAKGVVLEKGKPPAWTDQSPKEVNKRFGGDGEPYIVHGEDDEGSEMEFDPEEERHGQDADEPKMKKPKAPKSSSETGDMEFDGDEDMFPNPDSMTSKRIAPRDGYWEADIKDQTFAGCPAAVEQGARAQMAALQSFGNSGIFGPDFTPKKMAPQLEWTQVGANSWFGIMDAMTEGSGVFLQWSVQVISPTVIDHRQHLTFAMGPLGTCDVHSFIQAGWVK
jgi:hypothetical protein